VSTCIFGATKTSHVQENVKALELAGRWTQEIEDKFNAAIDNTPDVEMDFREWKP
jgi:aryl-alcohol dehydrogenase-like predicted oxidoreductase